MKDDFEVYTVGHSTQTYENFVNLLMHTGINAIVDVRSAPYSRRYPHFNREALKLELRADSIDYVFMGEELGGRPKEQRYFCDGVADYEKMSHAPAFQLGLDRVSEGRKVYRLALMCSEHSPLDCHRCLLVGRALKERGISLGHILGDGKVRSHEEIEAMLLKMSDMSKADMFIEPSARLAVAYRERSQKVAYSESGQITPAATRYSRDATTRDNNRVYKNKRTAFF